MVDLLQQFDADDHARSRQPVNPFDDTEGSLEPHHLQSARSVASSKEFPIFKREDANYQLPSGILHMTASNGYITITLVGNTIYRFHVKNPRGHAEYIELKRDDDRIRRLFQDPTGQHLLVCMESRDCIYIGRGGKRAQPRPLSKLRAHVESVAWNKVEQSDSSTGPILLGCSNGVIVETEIDTQEGALLAQARRSKPNLVEVYQLMRDLSDHTEPVTGLAMVPFPGRVNKLEAKYFILATTPKRIYQFIGTVNRTRSPQFLELFQQYDTVKVQFQEIPGTLNNSQLHMWPSNPKLSPTSFAWLTGAGLYYGHLGFEDQVPGDSLLQDYSLIPFPQSDPIGMLLTEFHCVLLYRDRVEAVCVLNEKLVFEDVARKRDYPLLSICVDPIQNTIYTHSKFKVVIYHPHRENRNVWKIFLDKGQYELAKKYSEGNQENMDIILVKQAEHFFKQERYHEAAVLFSQTQLSFEEVALKFIQASRTDALKLFLRKTLQSLPEKNKTQQTMLTTWLIELYLNELGVLRDDEKHGKQLSTMKKEFYAFLQTPLLRECLEANKKIVYDLISSHGASDDLIFFSSLMKDYERVIAHCIQNYNYEEALDILTARASEAKKTEGAAAFKRFADLFYKFSPILMQQFPRRTVQSWITMERSLEPGKLIPALVQCNQPTDAALVSSAITYLEFCVDTLKSRDRAIHNFLVSLYVKTRSRSGEEGEKLKQYLKKQSQDSTVYYDPQYALRLCMEHHLDEACVLIYAAMGLYAESVELALKMPDVELARSIARPQPMMSKDMQKRLWLMIAQHVIEEEKDIEKAMTFLKECTLLRIEDVLPFFSDFVTIDHFKDAICTSLSEYNAHIDDLKSEMKGATDSAKNIRSDIQDIRSKYSVIEADTKCEICELRLLTRGFYMFPCRHAFHKDCLAIEVKEMLSGNRKVQLENLLDGQEGHEGSRGKDSRKERIDDIIGAECLYCGELMIESIDKPFIPFDQFEEAHLSWL